MIDTTAKQQEGNEIKLVELVQNMMGSVVPADQEDDAMKMLDHLAGGGNLADLHGLTENDLELIYNMALTCYNNQKYNDSVMLFKFLCLMDNMGKKWWMGLGATRQMMKDYQQALQAYSYCIILDVDDPKPQLQSGFCLMQLGKYEEAVLAFEGALLAANADERTKIQAEALLASVEGKMEATAGAESAV